ncbi:PAS domain S-box protein [Candidatus Sulfurimonas marisnigri]|uniref:histidine kinase n=1 Tax=Candidatus Sulfurimonas marisnigri TaxID=2740405 RepID=A0A7S7RQE7_9BACT|nr:PAS domain S-box protein [Candidatus Sulfurimonas marisnigri]QOY54539.1 PAS domain S-box protein [Candidatus Sulfurimonas marisnigri]
MELKLKSIIETLKNSSGQQFFERIVLSMASSMDVDYVFIARLDSKKNNSTTIALTAKGKIVDNFSYELKNTPCADVSENSVCCFTQDITKLYPKDQLLIDMNIEAYIGTPLHDSQGNVMGIIVALSERKIENEDSIKTLFEVFSGRIAVEMEREILETSNRQYKERLELALEGSSDGLWDWDLTTNELYLSPRWKEMLGYKDDELSNEFSTWKENIHPEDIEQILYKIDSYLSHKITVFEHTFRMKHKNGSWVWILGRGKAQFDKDGNAVRLSGTHNDISKEKNLELKLNEVNNSLACKVDEQTKELQESKHFLETIFNTTKDSIAILDLNSNFLFVNDAYEIMTGFTKEELYTKSCIGLTIPEMIEESKKVLAKVIEDGYYEGYEKGCFTKENGVIDVKMNISLMPGGERILIVVRDITIENILKIERLVQENRFIEQSRLAQMGEMLSMIAHQWRQPLSAISSTVVNLQMKIELETFNLESKESRDAYSNYFFDRLVKIEDFVKTLTETIDDFRNFYKPNREPIEVTLQEVVTKALQIIKDSLKSDNVELICKYNSNIKIKTYSNEMMQVVLNILKNAQDNFKEKQIKNPHILITTEKDSITICDNGGGIDPGIKEKIFDPYFSTKNEKNGTGLGLYMSKRIVEEHHNGSLNVYNKGNGACFSILLKV